MSLCLIQQTSSFYHPSHRMTHWFHRNPLKATAPVSFNFYGVAGSPSANKICKYVDLAIDIHSQYGNWKKFAYMYIFLISDLRTTRARLLEMFTDTTCNPEIMKNATDAYFSLLQGEFAVLFMPFSPLFSRAHCFVVFLCGLLATLSSSCLTIFLLLLLTISRRSFD